MSAHPFATEAGLVGYRATNRGRRDMITSLTVVPLYARSVAALIGGLLVLAAWASAIRTLIVPRPRGRGLARWVAQLVNGVFRLAASVTAGYLKRDRVLAGQAAAILLAQLAAWLGTAFIGY